MNFYIISLYTLVVVTLVFHGGFCTLTESHYINEGKYLIEMNFYMVWVQTFANHRIFIVTNPS